MPNIKKQIAVNNTTFFIGANIFLCNSIFNVFFIYILRTFFVQEEILEALDDNNLRIFSELLVSAKQHDVDFNAHYGAESGYKTILHLALEEDDGLPYVEELILVRR